MNQNKIMYIILSILILGVFGASAYFIYSAASNNVNDLILKPTSKIESNKKDKITISTTSENTSLVATSTLNNTERKIIDWETFTNKKYGYSFKHPTTSDVVSQDYGVNEDIAYHVAINDKNTIFNVSVEDPNPPYKKSSLGLNEFTNKIWNLNKQDKNPNVKNKEVGPIMLANINGSIAYQFTLTESYTDDPDGKYGYTIDEKYIYTFINNGNGLNFMLWFPADDEIAKNILNAFSFTK
ncbi:MAG: hypothetical protein US81_C0001G0003 [Parcubacteria group bacterium GW2011_GWE2_38_18]|nr:MAG: hypothetical protein US81_C0001G0003 [Parcubacteria group bacterium GW2011_GWE2_38_18]